MLQIKEFHKTLCAVVPVRNAAYGNKELPNPGSVWWTPSRMDHQVWFYNSSGFPAFKAVKTPTWTEAKSGVYYFEIV